MEFDKTKKYYVYGWFLKENDECFYIGKGTKNRATTRTRKENPTFTEFVKKHDCYSKIIENGLDEETAFIREKELISYYRNKGNNLINVQDGGHLPPSSLGIKRSDETKEKMRASMKEYFKNNPEASKEISERMTKFLHSEKSEEFRRKSLETRRTTEFREAQRKRSIKANNTKEYIEKQSKIAKASWERKEYRDAHTGANNFRSQTVQQFDLDGNFINEFPTVTEAQKQTGINFSKISAVANGKRKSTGGFVWVYPNPKNNKSTVKRKGKVNMNQVKPVLQYDKEGNFLREFISVADAARYVGKGRSSIISNLRGSTKSAYGFVWKYK